MAIFDGHNDLLLNLWLHHREDPVTAFFAGVENGHLDYPRILQGGFGRRPVRPIRAAAGVYRPYDAAVRQPGVGSLNDILWQQLAILKAICAHDASRARLCLSAADIERCRQDKALAMVAHIEGAGGFDAQGRRSAGLLSRRGAQHWSVLEYR
ncbi:MAG: membrane dipeptidase [Klebsiella pneumoniae]